MNIESVVVVVIVVDLIAVIEQNHHHPHIHTIFCIMDNKNSTNMKVQPKL